MNREPSGLNRGIPGLQSGEEVNQPKQVAQSERLAGLTFVITGTLSQKRQVFEELIRNHGGKVAGSVSPRTSYLLMGPDAEGTTKHQQALKHGVPIIGETEFWAMLGTNV